DIPAYPGFFAGNCAGSGHRISGDGAFEATASTARVSGQALYGLFFGAGVRRFAFSLLPDDQIYYLMDLAGSPSGALKNGHSGNIRQGNGVNKLRMEARGNELRLYLNDEQVDRARDQMFGERPVSGGVRFARRASSQPEPVKIH